MSAFHDSYYYHLWDSQQQQQHPNVGSAYPHYSSGGLQQQQQQQHPNYPYQVRARIKESIARMRTLHTSPMLTSLRGHSEPAV